MANRNTNPGIGESVDSGVINTHQPSRARTHARVVRPPGILNESLIDIPGARARVRAKSADFTAWRVKTFGGDFDPVREAVEDAVAEFSDMLTAHTDTEIVIPAEAWTKFPEAGGNVIFTVYSGKGTATFTAKVADSE